MQINPLTIPHTLKHFVTNCAALLAAVLVLISCQAEGNEVLGGPTPALHVTQEAASTSTPTTNRTAEVTISGIVQEVSMSARTIKLQQRIDGYDLLALEPNARMIDLHGNRVDLNRLYAGAIVIASGRSGEPGVLLTDKIEISAEAATAPSSIETQWVAMSIYHPADSRRFQLTFDGELWQVVPGEFWDHLEHQMLTGCQLSPTGGQGLGEGWSVEKDRVTFGDIEYHRSQVYEGEILRYVAYYTSLERYTSAFRIDWQTNPQTCLSYAQEVLATLEVLSASEAIQDCRGRGGFWERNDPLGQGCRLPTPESQLIPLTDPGNPDWYVSPDESGSIEPTTQKGFEAWLSDFLSEETLPEYRLQEYQITSFASVSNPGLSAEYEHIFAIEYAVLPQSDPSHWIAGDGRYGEDGWIIEKLEYVGVVVGEDSIYLFRLGPCPQC
jgi:hypothetical protein